MLRVTMELAQDLSFDPDDLLEPEGVLRHFFGYRSFRPHQDEAIHALLAGHDTVVLLPTGGGIRLLRYEISSIRCSVWHVDEKYAPLGSTCNGHYCLAAYV